MRFFAVRRSRATWRTGLSSTRAPALAAGQLRLLLPGATLRDRLIASIGAALGVAAAGVAGLFLPGEAWLVAPMGASAVLVFAVPASPLAQPWPAIGGNVLSALIGVAVASLIHAPVAAAGIASALAILAMSLTRTLHPPGGAAALTAVLGGPAVAAWGWGLPVLVGVNAVALVAAGAAFHRFSGHAYPHRPVAVPPLSPFEPEDIDHALADLGEAFDVAREDLDLLLARAAHHAARRRLGRR